MTWLWFIAFLITFMVACFYHKDAYDARQAWKQALRREIYWRDISQHKQAYTDALIQDNRNLRKELAKYDADTY